MTKELLPAGITLCNQVEKLLCLFMVFERMRHGEQSSTPEIIGEVRGNILAAVHRVDDALRDLKTTILEENI